MQLENPAKVHESWILLFWESRWLFFWILEVKVIDSFLLDTYIPNLVMYLYIKTHYMSQFMTTKRIQMLDLWNAAIK